MAKELSKTYDPKDIEDRTYAKWVKNGYFHAEVNENKKPFTIVIPPPNITGKLHMGHALDETLQDILIRFKRMQGYEALWLPGTDHASISTEVKVIDQLKKEGTSKEELGREGFLKRTWEWKKEYGGTIVEQLKKLGSSCDWERERFTLDEGCSKAVEEVFVKLYEKGLIYKGAKIINWCPVCQTSISDAEVEHEDQDGFFWHINYPIAGTDRFVEIATTRPETLLGDTAVAVHPDDDRYKDIIGKHVILPIVNKEIPVVADSYVDMEFGTGVVKITPAHDPNDFEVGKRHNLEVINVLNDDATINEKGGAEYEGLDRYEARKKIVAELEKLGLLVKVVPHSHSVGTHDRCGTTVEPMVKQQWFVKMDELIKPAAEAVRKGEIRLIPERMNKTYFNWTDNIRDWCISRQLWWGHRIPAYYCKDCGEMVVAKTENRPEKCPKCGCVHMEQDEDTLDTWFSSALWPFSTLGWPEKTKELDYFYPTNVLVTGYDIIFFWVIRMIFSGYEHTGKKPFDTVLFHGLVRDDQGRKMSKSLGNGIDPLEIIDEYGADALRFTLVTGNAPGNDMRFYMERVQASRNFANKVWNASRFIMMNIEGHTLTEPSLSELSSADKWILSRLNTITKEVTDNMEHYDLGIAVSKLYDFIWDEFCDWYIELAKIRINQMNEKSANSSLWTLKTVLKQALQLLHPFMPFVTEEIFMTLLEMEEEHSATPVTKVDSIMISAWPEYKNEWKFEKDEEILSHCMDAIRAVRNLRTEMNVPHSRAAHVFIVSGNSEVKEMFESMKANIGKLLFANELDIQSDKTGIPDDAVSVVIPEAVVYMPLEDLVDLAKEKERLQKEEKRLEGELKRVNGMLSNEKFISKAPESKIKEEQEKKAKYENMMKEVKERLAQLG